MAEIELKNPAYFGICLEQSETGATFTVTYGLQEVDGLDYEQACKEFGACYFHALACESLIDNRWA